MPVSLAQTSSALSTVRLPPSMRMPVRPLPMAALFWMRVPWPGVTPLPEAEALMTRGRPSTRKPLVALCWDRSCCKKVREGGAVDVESVGAVADRGAVGGRGADGAAMEVQPVKL